MLQCWRLHPEYGAAGPALGEAAAPAHPSTTTTPSGNTFTQESVKWNRHFFRVPSPDVRGPGADSCSGLMGSAPGKKELLRRQTLIFLFWARKKWLISKFLNYICHHKLNLLHAYYLNLKQGLFWAFLKAASALGSHRLKIRLRLRNTAQNTKCWHW